MRLARIGAEPERWALVEGDGLVEIAETLTELIAGAAPTATGRRLDPAHTTLLAPVSGHCRGVFCTGINYTAHQQESAEAFSATVPPHPIIFFKTVSALCGPYDELPLDPAVSPEFDWEGELGVVIGTGGRDIPVARALEHVFAYTVVNDITARDIQRRHQQWHLGKNVDAATPVGPWLVTADEFADGALPADTVVELRVNGVAKQRAVTADMIFDVATQISVISATTALLPGDVISTGTPAGVGFTRTPPEFLADGDIVETEVTGVGLLRNVVRAGARTPVTTGAAISLTSAPTASSAPTARKVSV
ncbi:2-keto-4-pentenoate hydratase/2-oxohepta-3-ene-1,7-dioic acid hydratase (catechol pathway) [Parafrankia irregularis]|uniref:2-keto-4-pentenoate hydratase/2-oxohepta-3-ene-1,7-dioic acid hydratase (Catechol pathway) n=1 Tax=Parafrankia irregularis TaxID=795642 RepID=A0A0S4QHC5_9ACTN|nr:MULTISPECIES: fumarylacetoacetate hydrolase family protein [Parafrankia]MBE3200962.1 fumarylacetoacetate hydrolase family protein [Parafrankia sp. CH37]CUU54638.1 2-keto-4-pentenoate hydratase/2-oxohepta-3-ene-1,7-dioic acid hydratase (catechol pathway) [Parafrankia irregularis]